MYVTPRPRVFDDPLYAIRLAATGTLAYAAIPMIDPALPPVVAALSVGLIAAQRMAFSPVKAMAGPIAFTVAVWIIAFLVEQLRPMPVVYIVTMGLIYFAGYRMILATGAQACMLIIVVTVLMSVMGMSSNAALETMRNTFTQASILAFLLIPGVFAVFPPRSRELFVETPVPATGNIDVGAAIRAGVLLMMSFWLYALMQPSDMMMAVVAAMVLVFPTRRAVLIAGALPTQDPAYATFVRIMLTLMGALAATLLIALLDALTGWNAAESE